jgi:hypothetical protein
MAMGSSLTDVLDPFPNLFQLCHYRFSVRLAFDNTVKDQKDLAGGLFVDPPAGEYSVVIPHNIDRAAVFRTLLDRALLSQRETGNH